MPDRRPRIVLDTVFSPTTALSVSLSSSHVTGVDRSHVPTLHFRWAIQFHGKSPLSIFYGPYGLYHIPLFFFFSIYVLVGAGRQRSWSRPSIVPPQTPAFRCTPTHIPFPSPSLSTKIFCPFHNCHTIGSQVWNSCFLVCITLVGYLNCVWKLLFCWTFDFYDAEPDIVARKDDLIW